MALEEFIFDRGIVRGTSGHIVERGPCEPLEIGTEVLVINSHADGRYSSIGKYAGLLKKSEWEDVKSRVKGYDNIVLKETVTLPVEIKTDVLIINDEYHRRIVNTIKHMGIKEGKTSHALDLATKVYRVI